MQSNQSSFAENSNSCRSFTISQVAPGALLQFDPPMHSKELAEAIHAYIPGSFTLQEKQRQISSEFCFWRSMACPEGPASYFYDASPVLEFSSFSSNELSFDQHLPSMIEQSSFGTKESSGSKSAPTRRSKANKVAKKTPAKVASGPRLPGFSIMTKDGIDITDLAPRGPKTKEQREHAAMMRKLQACPTCKKRKQRCNPSHHLQNNTSPSSASTKTSSPPSSAFGSQASTPTSSVVSGNNSPFQRHSQEIQISQTGQHFNGTLPSPKTALTPTDFALLPAFDMLSNTPFTLDSADLDMDIVDPSFLDVNMVSSAFEPMLNDFIEDSAFDSWINYQDNSTFSNIPGQLDNVPSSVPASSSHNHNTSTADLHGSNRFVDFVPDWEAGSELYIPVDGSSLQWPEEFGVPSDISHFASRNSRGEDRLHDDVDLDHPPNKQLASLFGEYSSSSAGSPVILTPISMTTTNSSQGFSSSMARSSSVIVHDSSLEMNSPTPLQNNTVSSFDDTSYGGALTQSQRHRTNPYQLQLVSLHGTVEPPTVITSHAYDGGDLFNSLQPGLDGIQPGAPVSSSEFIPGRMTPVIQSSWGARTEQGLDSQEIIATYAVPSADSQRHARDDGSAIPNDDYVIPRDQLQATFVKQQDQGRSLMAQQDTMSSALTVTLQVKHSVLDVIARQQQRSSLDVIPQGSSRPFRLEDSSSLLLGNTGTYRSASGMLESAVSIQAHQRDVVVSSSQTIQREDRDWSRSDTVAADDYRVAIPNERIQTEKSQPGAASSQPVYHSPSHDLQVITRQLQPQLCEVFSAASICFILLAICFFVSSLLGTNVMNALVSTFIPTIFYRQFLGDTLKAKFVLKKAANLESYHQLKSIVLRSHLGRSHGNSCTSNCVKSLFSSRLLMQMSSSSLN